MVAELTAKALDVLVADLLPLSWMWCSEVKVRSREHLGKDLEMLSWLVLDGRFSSGVGYGCTLEAVERRHGTRSLFACLDFLGLFPLEKLLWWTGVTDALGKTWL